MIPSTNRIFGQREMGVSPIGVIGNNSIMEESNTNRPLDTSITRDTSTILHNQSTSRNTLNANEVQSSRHLMIGKA